MAKTCYIVDVHYNVNSQELREHIDGGNKFDTIEIINDNGIIAVSPLFFQGNMYAILPDEENGCTLRRIYSLMGTKEAISETNVRLISQLSFPTDSKCARRVNEDYVIDNISQLFNVL